MQPYFHPPEHCTRQLLLSCSCTKFISHSLFGPWLLHQCHQLSTGHYPFDSPHCQQLGKTPCGRCHSAPCTHRHWPLHQAILNQQLIQLVSDAAIHPTRYGMCAWVIWASSSIWSGEGYVPGPSMDMYLGLAEAYGICTVLSFLHQYICLHPMAIENLQPIHVYCDNSSVIDQKNNHTSTLYPHDTIQDDYPIFAEICNHVTQLHPFTFVFHHVTGHQDKKSEQPLTTPECLNIDCNARASKLPPAPSHLGISYHPSNLAGFPHLCINNHVVMQCLQHVLHNAATQGMHFQYLTTKFHWQVV